MLPTTAPVSEQRDALFRRVGEMVEAAGRSGVNVLCLQEAWSEFALYLVTDKFAAWEGIPAWDCKTVLLYGVITSEKHSM